MAGSTKPTPPSGSSRGVKLVSRRQAQRPATDAAVDGEEVLGIVGAERDRLGAERRRAPLAVGMALPVGIARGTGGQPDALVSLPLDDQAAGVDAGGRRAGPNRSAGGSALLRAQRAEQEGRGCVRLVAGVASGHEEAHSCRESGEPQERQQRRMPGDMPGASKAAVLR